MSHTTRNRDADQQDIVTLREQVRTRYAAAAQAVGAGAGATASCGGDNSCCADTLTY